MTAWIMAGLALGLQGGPTMDTKERQEGVAGVARLMEEGYAYPEVGKRMAEALRESEARGEYDYVPNGRELAFRLTQQLKGICHDEHLSVSYDEHVLDPEPPVTGPPSDAVYKGMRSRFARDNFGLQKVEILAGNVGYLDFRYFAPNALARDTYAGAMATVANTDALIIDLRQNGGSLSPKTIPNLLGYFFKDPVPLCKLKWRSQPKATQYWTSKSVKGSKYLDKPIYALTSGRTFSGAEEMAYDLKVYKRARIVGESTGGGANPVGPRRASDHFFAMVPSGIVTHAVTGTNWEGLGVIPDAGFFAFDALRAAHVEALESLREKSKEEAQKAAFTEDIKRIGENPVAVQGVPFELYGFPEAKEVVVTGSFCFWASRGVPMKRKGNSWVGIAYMPPGEVSYKFIVDGRWMPDPANLRHSGSSPDSDSVRTVR